MDYYNTPQLVTLTGDRRSRRARRRARRARRRRIGRNVGRGFAFRFAPLPVKLLMLRRMRKKRALRKLVSRSRSRRAARRAKRRSRINYNPYATRYVSGDGEKFKKILSNITYNTPEGPVKYIPGKGLSIVTPQSQIKAQNTLSTTTADIFKDKRMLPVIIGGGVLLYIISNKNKG